MDSVNNNHSLNHDAPRDPTMLLGSPQRSSSSSRNTARETRWPANLYQVPPKRQLRRRHEGWTRAINIDGMQIDVEEIRYGASRPTGIISVHKCQWGTPDTPCDMWVIGDKAIVGSHLRKWHKHNRQGGRVACQWQGCGKRMRKDSLNRHVVSIHLGETFICDGCGAESVRKDVHNQHTEDCEECGGMDAQVTYQVETRVINARAALGSQ
ncbi:hypothetical protein HYDPIDRAFT_119742 [Hydnomerulius pinastri MD-312]|uniref:C2H2-type domain-containing protein n=1 Tax=Hydnomerulius pinastri MD-312 TaxID=994086 RepID=A0A0C9W6C5_9AGAM|nr:hypothetical protein HYDPIDRAFT_119742 [Hydnomerulius pinastri MD-312]